MPQGLVSVVLPTFNRARTLRRAINSVLSQTYDNLELLIIDDGSTDDTASVISGITDGRLRYIRLPHNRGVSHARNVGMAHAKGNLIAFQDSDDEWLLNKLELLVAALLTAGTETDAICAFHTKIMYVPPDNDAGRENLVFCIPALSGHIDQSYLTQEIVKFNLVSTQTLMLTKSALKLVGGFDEALANNEDWDFAIALITKCRAVFLNSPLVIAYLQSDSVSHLTRKGARSQLRIAQKMSRRSGVDQKVLARHYGAIGWWLCKLGNPRSGGLLIRRSLSLQPMSAKSVAQLSVAFALAARERFTGRRSVFAASALTVRSSNRRLAVKRA